MSEMGRISHMSLLSLQDRNFGLIELYSTAESTLEVLINVGKLLTVAIMLITRSKRLLNHSSDDPA